MRCIQACDTSVTPHYQKHNEFAFDALLFITQYTLITVQEEKNWIRTSLIVLSQCYQLRIIAGVSYQAPVLPEDVSSLLHGPWLGYLI